MSNDIRSFVIGIIGEIDPTVTESVSDDQPLGPGGLELESLALVELLVQVEHEFGATIADEDPAAQPTATLGEFVAAVARHRDGASTEAHA
ncbi:acyl carrier protein [Streptomyces sp. 2132.2]|uniref:acyl carrier protein n=1 Tax=Streptomyces TaxID=1883 RepID=UPI000F475EFF|nr:MULTISPECIES: acyl carrier protein [unclassified Streptomyces]ROQ89061.1 acyl carrier protein [Streptomyces sp. 2132.2]WSI29240.1 acyl carrier protein [Streptomyces sp. NBC_01343]